jgi:hypothetical protein
MKDDKIEVKEIVLTIEGKEISLSLDQTRKLMEALKALFPDPITFSYPIIVDRYPKYTWPYDPWRPYYLSDNTCKVSYEVK